MIHITRTNLLIELAKAVGPLLNFKGKKPTMSGEELEALIAKAGTSIDYLWRVDRRRAIDRFRDAQPSLMPTPIRFGMCAGRKAGYPLWRVFSKPAPMCARVLKELEGLLPVPFDAQPMSTTYDTLHRTVAERIGLSLDGLTSALYTERLPGWRRRASFDALLAHYIVVNHPTARAVLQVLAAGKYAETHDYAFRMTNGEPAAIEQHVREGCNEPLVIAEFFGRTWSAPPDATPANATGPATNVKGDRQAALQHAFEEVERLLPDVEQRRRDSREQYRRWADQATHAAEHPATLHWATATVHLYHLLQFSDNVPIAGGFDEVADELIRAAVRTGSTGVVVRMAGLILKMPRCTAHVRQKLGLFKVFLGVPAWIPPVPKEWAHMFDCLDMPAVQA